MIGSGMDKKGKFEFAVDFADWAFVIRIFRMLDIGICFQFLCFNVYYWL